jgi:uncharacterized protein YjcR
MVTQQGIAEKEEGYPTPSPNQKKSKTTSGRFPHPVKGLAKSKPKGGAPLGNRNALKTGRHTAQMRALRKEVWTILSDGRALLRNLNDIVRANP